MTLKDPDLNSFLCISYIVPELRYNIIVRQGYSRLVLN